MSWHKSTTISSVPKCCWPSHELHQTPASQPCLFAPLLFTEIRGDPGMKIIWPLSRACCCRNGLRRLADLSAGKEGAGWLGRQISRAQDQWISPSQFCHGLSKAHKQTSLRLPIPLIQPQRHEASRSIPCHEHSASPYNAVVSVFPLGADFGQQQFGTGS